MTKIKICGLSRQQDIDYVNTALPDYVGFVLAPSKRQVSPEQAAMLSRKLDSRITAVGVFINAPVEQIVSLYRSGTIKMAQLHGNEPDDYIAALKSHCDIPIIKAVAIYSTFPVPTTPPSVPITQSPVSTDPYSALATQPPVPAFIAGPTANAIGPATSAGTDRGSAMLEGGNAGTEDDYVLFDYKEPGSGQQFDWNLLRDIDYPFFLAGGINIQNIHAALEFNPYCIDISSGAETDGVKDGTKIAQLVRLAHAWDNGDGADVPVLGQQPRPRCPTERKRGKMTKGRFGDYGGQYIPETLMNELLDLESAYNHYQQDEAFNVQLQDLLNNYAGRPSLLYYAAKMTKDLGGARVYLKREDLNHTGSHKINNVLGQALLAKKRGKTRIIAETGAGQHGVAAATAAALMGLECEVFMGKEDTERQALNVYRMELLGAKVNAVTSGTQTLKDAVNEAMRNWVSRINDTHYVLGSVMGPHPFPTMVRNFQAVISAEARAQILQQEGALPAAVIACVGGGSNAIGMFYNFIADKDVRLIGCEAAGRGLDTPDHAATIAKGQSGVFHGMKSLFCQDQNGQIAPVYSISAGLDYPGIGPEHAYLHSSGRAEYYPITDEEAVCGFEYLAAAEGIIAAIESAHAIAYAQKLVPTLSPEQNVIICLSGRGDKDVAAIARYRKRSIHE
ncbi:hypothetical protein FACS1894104_1940 [Actinomycetota bacterium]|nr:hypothetical protein FACS1894104_1940 [Actinomycetota bacterium]